LKSTIQKVCFFFTGKHWQNKYSCVFFHFHQTKGKKVFVTNFKAKASKSTWNARKNLLAWSRPNFSRRKAGLQFYGATFNCPWNLKSSWIGVGIQKNPGINFTELHFAQKLYRIYFDLQNLDKFPPSKLSVAIESKIILDLWYYKAILVDNHVHSN
jgi:hypothetical protein